MSRLDELPADQRAALALLLRQRKSYREVAALLGIEERAVHDRAHAALAVLAPREARALDAAMREQIGEYLLGQQRLPSEQRATHGLLARSPAARTWAQRLAAQLSGLADGALPELPAPPDATGAPAPAAPAEPFISPRSAEPPAPAAPAEPPARQAPARAPGGLPSSRLGGALLLGAIVAGVVVAVILISGGGGSSHPKARAASSGGKASSSSPKVDARLVLKAPQPSSKTIALVDVLSEGGKTAFYIAAEHLPPSRGFNYVIWLYNSPSSYEGLSVASPVGSNEQLAGGSFLPENAADYREMLITKEYTSHPRSPGQIVLRGAFSLSD